jgi:putative ABC transport system permease protein
MGVFAALAVVLTAIGVHGVVAYSTARLLARFVASLLFNVTATDATTFAVVGIVLAAIALIATALPASRAVRVDPMLALRSE